MNQHQKEHENWIRYNAVNLAYLMNRFSNIDRILEDAEKITKFILRTPDCKIIPLKTIVESEGEV